MKHSTRNLPRSISSSILLLLVCLPCGSVAIADIQSEALMVPLRDGVRLASEIYRDEAATTAPVVLMRMPYNKDRAKEAAEQFAAAGYVAVVQDCRSKFASEGAFIPYNHEGQDGYDAVPDGASYNLAGGILRGRFRDSELESGHQLRVDICGTYFPLFDRNPKTGEGPFGKAPAVATESVYYTPPKPSRILLPVLSSSK